MKVDTKYDIKQSVWVMWNNRPAQTEITEIIITASHLRWPKVSYFLALGDIVQSESEIHATKESLIASL